jgi:Protein of unknown function (DUF3093)
MRNYRERLSAPASWWLLALLCVLLFGSTLWAGFSLRVAVAVYLVLGAGCAAALLLWGRATIEVTSGELRAGSAHLSLSLAGEVSALDDSQARALRGPRADPTAYLLIRPHLKRAVYVEVVGQFTARPYWLIGTRRPAELAAAIERSRPSA